MLKAQKTTKMQLYHQASIQAKAVFCFPIGRCFQGTILQPITYTIKIYEYKKRQIFTLPNPSTALNMEVERVQEIGPILPTCLNNGDKKGESSRYTWK